MGGGMFKTPVTLPPPNTAPLEPTGEPARASAEAIENSYAAVLSDITAWLDSKDRAQATSILDSLEDMLPVVGGMANNLPDSKDVLNGGCGPQARKRSSSSTDLQESEDYRLGEGTNDAASKSLRGRHPVIRKRGILGDLLGGLKGLLCTTTSLMDQFTQVINTVDQVVINNLANNIQTISGNIVKDGLSKIIEGNEDDGDSDGDIPTQDPTSAKDPTSTEETTTEVSTTASTQEVSTTTSITSPASSSSSPCTETITATYQSVFCTVTASATLPGVQRREECSSVIYTTAIGCAISNTATTTTTTVSPSITPWDEMCSPETCGSCSHSDTDKAEDLPPKAHDEQDLEQAQDTRGLLQKRQWEDAPKRSREVQRGEWAEPADYNGDVEAFFRGEVGRTYDVTLKDVGAVALSTANSGAYTSSYARPWLNEVATVGVAVWENPSFTGELITGGFMYQDIFDLDESGNPREKIMGPVFEAPELKEARFQRDIIGAIHTGNPSIDGWHRFGLDELRNSDNPQHLLGHMFDNAEETRVFIVTPRPRAAMEDPNRHIDQNAGQRAFEHEIQSIREEIDDIFDEKAPIQVIDYYPLITPIDWPYNDKPAAVRDYQSDSTGQKVNGKILIQYKPAPDCHGKASYRVWHEGQVLDDESLSFLRELCGILFKQNNYWFINFINLVTAGNFFFPIYVSLFLDPEYVKNGVKHSRGNKFIF
ncbi:hypothetical protein DL768_004265 [Monosporascus sp. mg162]|nr:hypothetical protein DL768_004265 [Monosporascus sp. mg162]